MSDLVHKWSLIRPGERWNVEGLYILLSAKTVIRKLVECVSKNGNLLLNVGPDAKGDIPKQSLDILAEVGEWMRRNGECIYGCHQAEFPKPEWGRYTQEGYGFTLERSPFKYCGVVPKVSLSWEHAESVGIQRGSSFTAICRS